MADVSKLPDVTSARESQLIRCIKAGRTELFSDLVQPYSQSLRAVLRSILRDPSDVEDVLQDTMLKAFVHLHQLHDEQNFKNWLHQIGRNEARTRQRRNRKTWANISLPEGEVTGEEETQNGACDFVDLRKLPSETVADEEFRVAVALVMNSLPEIYRRIFVLHDIQQVSMNEAIKILGISEAAGTSRLHRARLYIRQQLQAFLPLKSPPQKTSKPRTRRTGT